MGTKAQDVVVRGMMSYYWLQKKENTVPTDRRKTGVNTGDFG